MNIEFLKKEYPIQTWINNPILRTKSKKIENIDENIRQFSDILLTLMYEYDGVWLAAPQIWENIRMIAITKWDIQGDRYNFIEDKVMINPEIIWHSQEQEIDEEACLSVPGRKGKVSRFKQIVVKYQTVDWKIKEEKLSWFNARIVQHEIDHLDGVLFVDKVIQENKVNLSNLVKNVFSK